jgi:CheY-like chemotaxis protein
MGKTLLLADDSVTIQKVVGISFASEDIAITTVDNGDDAISRAREIRPDVILADVVMPGKSGYEVCEAVKTDPDLRHIPVLLLTGTFEAFDEERAARAGAAGQIAKPFEAHTLVERVKHLLVNTPSAPPVAAAPETPTPMPSTKPKAIPANPAAGVGDADNTFDFFDDGPATETLAAAEAPPPAPTNPQIPDSPRTDLEIEGPDAAFTFGEDELGSPTAFVPPAATPLQPAAHTVAILPDDVPADDEQEEPRFEPPPQPPAPPTDDGPPPIPQSLQDASERYDFELEGTRSQTSASAPEPHGLAESTLLDPSGHSAYDVSSSELGDLSVPSPSAAATPLLETPFPGAAAAPGGEPSPADPVGSLGNDPVIAMLNSDPVESGPAAPSDGFVPELPTAAPNRAGDPMAHSAPPPPREEADWPEPPSSSAQGAPKLSEPTPMSEPALPEPMPMPEPEMPEPMPEPALAKPIPGPVMPEHEPAESVSLADDALAQIAPALQEQIHETLEKIAWEAFGKVTERIVEQSVERIEEIAWEVVPKLAETLISEEIRKLKGR